MRSHKQEAIIPRTYRLHWPLQDLQAMTHGVYTAITVTFGVLLFSFTDEESWLVRVYKQQSMPIPAYYKL